MDYYRQFIRDIPDFPKEGILFKDITPLLGDTEALQRAIHDMASPYMNMGIDKVIGIESRGFLFGPGVAGHLGCGFAPIRKPGRLPYETHKLSYDLEYGSDTIEIHVDALEKGTRVVIVDDLLATGGTACAAARLVENMGGEIVGFSFLIELAFLNGKKSLGNHEHKVKALITYD